MYQTFFCIFRTNFAMATLGLKEMGKCKKKSGTYYEKGVGHHASFPPRRSVNQILVHDHLMYFIIVQDDCTTYCIATH